MQQLSLLIFSNNDIKEAQGLVEDLYSIVDQIVIVDSSKRREFNSLKNFKAKNKLVKLEIHRAPAFGYADPAREYGLLLCKHRWVLYVDTDERLNEALKTDIKKLIAGNTSVYAIKRFEDAHITGEKGTLFTWQIRLYDKNRIRYRGVIHEQPIVNGHVERMPDKYCMLHIREFRKARRYGELELFECFSYATYNKRLMEYLQSLTVPDREIGQTATGKAAYALLRAYEVITFRHQEQEISGFDYVMYYSLRDFVLNMRMRNIGNMLRVIPRYTEHVRKLELLRKKYNNHKIFEISKIIETDGIIRFLELDNRKKFEALTREYENKPQGVDLLIKLLIKRYDGLYAN